MDLVTVLGYVGALFMGVTLGLIGGGGSILTVPIFVYLFFINPVTATAYSLFVVGTTALVGAINNIKNKLVDFRTAFVFSVPAFISVYITRKYIIPAIPDHLFSWQGFTLTKNIAIMVFFAIIMLMASISMIRSNAEEIELSVKRKFNYPLILVEGTAIGLVTGIVGAGGGFLIIPALVLLAKLPMKKAVGTSLLIIAIKSLIGFIGDLEVLEIDWVFLLSFTFLSIIGIFIGARLSQYIAGGKLKIGFGWFVLLMGIYVIIREFSG